MNTTLKQSFLTSLILSWIVGPVFATTNPSSAIVKIYEMRLSPNTDCSNSVSIFTDPSGTPRDMVLNPSIGAGAIPNGTYRCFMVHISDEITFTPAANDGANCVQGTSYTRDIFRAGSTSTAPDGTVIVGRGASASSGIEDFPWAYFTPGGNTNGSCLDPHTPCILAAPVVVTGDRSLTFVVDFDNKVDGNQIPCDLGPSTMSFR